MYSFLFLFCSVNFRTSRTPDNGVSSPGVGFDFNCSTFHVFARRHYLIKSWIHLLDVLFIRGQNKLNIYPTSNSIISFDAFRPFIPKGPYPVNPKNILFQLIHFNNGVLWNDPILVRISKEYKITLRILIAIFLGRDQQ